MSQLYYNVSGAVEAFIAAGGEVLLIIGLVMLLMWALILERLIYFRTGHVTELRQVAKIWNERTERQSWEAHQVRIALIARVHLSATRSIPMIKTLVAICPLLGLVGTVTGMISVFDVVALMGSGNTRAMAAGVSKATIPTMAGMVGALSGVFLGTLLERKAKREEERLAGHLTMDY